MNFPIHVLTTWTFMCLNELLPPGTGGVLSSLPIEKTIFADFLKTGHILVTVTVK